MGGVRDDRIRTENHGACSPLLEYSFDMTVASHALGFKRFRQGSLELSLLRSDSFPVVLAVVAQYFPQGAIAKPASDLY